MIDYFLRWTNETTAKSDALMLANYLGVEVSPGVRNWMGDKVLPNVQAWRPSQDTFIASSLSSGETTVVHNYLTGWFAIVALNRSIDLLLNSSELAFALSRDGPPYVIKNNIGAIISDVACAPVFAGSHYPIGGFST